MEHLVVWARHVCVQVLLEPEPSFEKRSFARAATFPAKVATSAATATGSSMSSGSWGNRPGDTWKLVLLASQDFEGTVRQHDFSLGLWWKLRDDGSRLFRVKALEEPQKVRIVPQECIKGCMIDHYILSLAIRECCCCWKMNFSQYVSK